VINNSFPQFCNCA